MLIVIRGLEKIDGYRKTQTRHCNGGPSDLEAHITIVFSVEPASLFCSSCFIVAGIIPPRKWLVGALCWGDALQSDWLLGHQFDGKRSKRYLSFIF